MRLSAARLSANQIWSRMEIFYLPTLHVAVRILLRAFCSTPSNLTFRWTFICRIHPSSSPAMFTPDELQECFQNFVKPSVP